MLWIMSYASASVAYGIIFVAPLTLVHLYGDVTENYESVTWIALTSFPSILLATVVIDIPQLGRKNSMGIGFILTSLVLFLIYYSKGILFI